jgi:hypothetical protein
MTKQPNPEFERFANFAKQIIAVPKAVIDRRQAAWQKKRKALKSAKA